MIFSVIQLGDGFGTKKNSSLLVASNLTSKRFALLRSSQSVPLHAQKLQKCQKETSTRHF
jgi:hypothetical protein